MHLAAACGYVRSRSSGRLAEPQVRRRRRRRRRRQVETEAEAEAEAEEAETEEEAEAEEAEARRKDLVALMLSARHITRVTTPPLCAFGG
jgi:hypothetical protein